MEEDSAGYSVKEAGDVIVGLDSWTSEEIVVSEDNLLEQRDEVLALQSIYEGSDEERIRVVTEPDESGHGLFRLQMKIPVTTQAETYQVDLMLPASESESASLQSDSVTEAEGGQREEEEMMAVGGEQRQEEGATAMTPPPKFGKGVTLQRSLSGQRWTGSFKVHYLCPLTLQVTFPPNYPSEGPPAFTLSCVWLRRSQISTACKQLNQLWESAPNMPVVFTWVDWIENEIFSFLGLTNSLVLMPEDTDQDYSVDDYAVSQNQDTGEAIHTLLQYSEQKEAVEFCKSMQECCLCFDEKPGSRFFRLVPCKHHFCFDCIATHCRLHVSAGTIELLNCPDSDCEGKITPDVLHAVLSPEEFIRWETLSLQKSLDEMDDIVYCPRCQAIVIREQDKTLNLGYCLECCFSFCTDCEQPWHQGSQCTSELERLDAQGQRIQARDNRAKQRYEELRRQAVEKSKNIATLREKTVRCPHCKVPVEKIAGCNKMTCRCGQVFCWLCGKGITGYDHFTSSRCPLFQYQTTTVVNVVARRRPPDALLWMQAQAELQGDRKNREMRCVQCKQTNYKIDKNNHIHCWNCKSHLCFNCRSRITGIITQHFITSGCPQHS